MLTCTQLVGIQHVVWWAHGNCPSSPKGSTWNHPVTIGPHSPRWPLSYCVTWIPSYCLLNTASIRSSMLSILSSDWLVKLPEQPHIPEIGFFSLHLKKKNNTTCTFNKWGSANLLYFNVMGGRSPTKFIYCADFVIQSWKAQTSSVEFRCGRNGTSSRYVCPGSTICN